ncbi:hypothetical protein PPEV_gp160 [Pseudomonas phage EL]|uniref:Uncharacterized protein n=1 Tax=Pseudomonas phage EL TaxID=273133 RepID=Q2Z0S1_9CAUD|nr:hypothetical protein PPEV_gp160 [Pseudomonas phage EL]CAG27254.1 hypothetical protein [Pseudomonas phage EL]
MSNVIDMFSWRDSKNKRSSQFSVLHREIEALYVIQNRALQEIASADTVLAYEQAKLFLMDVRIEIYTKTIALSQCI